MSANELSPPGCAAPVRVATRPYAVAVGIAVLGLYASQVAGAGQRSRRVGRARRVGQSRDHADAERLFHRPAARAACRSAAEPAAHHHDARRSGAVARHHRRCTRAHRVPDRFVPCRPDVERDPDARVGCRVAGAGGRSRPRGRRRDERAHARRAAVPSRGEPDRGRVRMAQLLRARCRRARRDDRMALDARARAAPRASQLVCGADRLAAASDPRRTRVAAARPLSGPADGVVQPVLDQHRVEARKRAVAAWARRHRIVSRDASAIAVSTGKPRPLFTRSSCWQPASRCLAAAMCCRLPWSFRCWSCRRCCSTSG